MHGKNVKK